MSIEAVLAISACAACADCSSAASRCCTASSAAGRDGCLLAGVLHAGLQFLHRLFGGLGALERLLAGGGGIVAAAVERGERDAERLHGVVGGRQPLGHRLVTGWQLGDVLFDLADARAQGLERLAVGRRGAASELLHLFLQRRDLRARRTGIARGRQRKAGVPERQHDERHHGGAGNAGGDAAGRKLRAGWRRGFRLRIARFRRRFAWRDGFRGGRHFGRGQVDGRRLALAAAAARRLRRCGLVCHKPFLTRFDLPHRE